VKVSVFLTHDSLDGVTTRDVYVNKSVEQTCPVSAQQAHTPYRKALVANDSPCKGLIVCSLTEKVNEKWNKAKDPGQFRVQLHKKMPSHNHQHAQTYPRTHTLGLIHSGSYTRVHTLGLIHSDSYTRVHTLGFIHSTRDVMNARHSDANHGKRKLSAQ
jgi:hypothetical protein